MDKKQGSQKCGLFSLCPNVLETAICVVVILYVFMRMFTFKFCKRVCGRKK